MQPLSAQHCHCSSSPLLLHGGSASASSSQGRGGAERSERGYLKGHYLGRFFLRVQCHFAGPLAVWDSGRDYPPTGALALRLCLGVCQWAPKVLVPGH